MNQLGKSISSALATRLLGAEQLFSEVEERLLVTWPSQNPKVLEPLVLDCREYPALYWFRGYFCDFPYDVLGLSQDQIIQELCDFLEDFFAERIIQANGGPVNAPIKLRHYHTVRMFVEWENSSWVRSWKGSIDEGPYDELP